MSSSSIPPLLQPPPQDLRNDLSMRQWMEGVYRQVYALSVASNAETTPVVEEETVVALPEVLLATISTSPYDFTNNFSSTYKSYRLSLSGIYTSGSNLVLNFSTNGSTADTAASYNYVSQAAFTASTALSSSDVGTSIYIAHPSYGLGTTAITGMTGEVKIFNGDATTYYPAIESTAINVLGGVGYRHTTSGVYRSLTTATGILLSSTSGTLSGTMRLYGII